MSLLSFLRQRRLAWHAKRTTPLGRELVEAMATDAWTFDARRLTHKKSDVTLWIGNGFDNFRLYEVIPLGMGEIRVRELLNYHDRYVLWWAFNERRKKDARRPGTEVLNYLRLKRQTGDMK